MTDHPHIDVLMHGYFHQDYDLNGSDVPEIAAVYAADAGPGETAATIADIRRYLASDACGDADFRRRYPDEVDPAGWGMTAAEWLSWLAESLARAH